MHEPLCMGFSQRVTHLREHVNGAFDRHRAKPIDQRLEIEAVEQFHHVVERALGDPEVVELNGVG